MNKIAFIISSLILVSTVALAQVRVSSLVIEKGKTYSLGQSDILVADTIIMKDGARILLNKLAFMKNVFEQFRFC